MRRAGRRSVRRMMRRRRRRRRRRIILAGGLIALGAHKLSKKDTERVEEYTGKSAEDLSDEELEQAMGELGYPHCVESVGLSAAIWVVAVVIETYISKEMPFPIVPQTIIVGIILV